MSGEVLEVDEKAYGRRHDEGKGPEGISVESGRNDEVQQREQEAEKNRMQEVETWASVLWYWLHPADI